MRSVALQGVVSGWLPEVQGVLKLVRLQYRHISYILCYKIVLMFYNVEAMTSKGLRSDSLSTDTKPDARYAD
jgi:hypothetical protein